MRVAVMIIALCLVMVIGVHSCAVGVGSSMIGDQATAQAGVYGVFLAFLFVLGAAFVLKLPGVSAAIFLLGGGVAIFGNRTGIYSDLSLWGGVSVVLGLMALIGRGELRPRRVVVEGGYPIYRRYDDSDDEGGKRSVAGVSWNVLAVIGFAVLVAGGIYGSGLVKISNTAGQVTDTPEEPLLAATAAEIAAAYAANEVAAQLRFGHHRLDVTGVIAAITLDAADNPVLRLRGINTITGDVSAAFGTDWSKAIAGLKVGETVTIRCTKVAELMGSAMLSGCGFPPLATDDAATAADAEADNLEQQADAMESAADNTSAAADASAPMERAVWSVTRDENGSPIAMFSVPESEWDIEVACVKGRLRWSVLDEIGSGGIEQVALGDAKETVTVAYDKTELGTYSIFSMDPSGAVMQRISDTPQDITVGTGSVKGVGREVREVVNACS